MRRHDLRQQSKRNAEVATTIAKDYVKEVAKKTERIQDLEFCLETYLRKVVMETTIDMDGPRNLEK